MTDRLFDHCHVADRRAHIGPLVAGLLQHHDRNLDRVANAEKALKNFALGKLPKRRHLRVRLVSTVPAVANTEGGCYAPSMSELLFSYGTLRQRDVQRATFGREIDGYDDAIIGYHLEYVTITDPHVIATSGSARHPILRPTDRPDAHVDGTVFTISEAELAAADDYEVDDYRRISVPLRSGPQAWVYVFAG